MCLPSKISSFSSTCAPQSRFIKWSVRGTRLDPVTNKLMFRIYDYTNATRLFGEDFHSRIKSKSTGDGDRGDTPTQPTVLVEGLEVQVTDAGKYILSGSRWQIHTDHRGRIQTMPIRSDRRRNAQSGRLPNLLDSSPGIAEPSWRVCQIREGPLMWCNLWTT